MGHLVDRIYSRWHPTGRAGSSDELALRQPARRSANQGGSMALATECRYDGKVISVEKALEIRDGTRASVRKHLDFRCLECGEQVRPHRESGSQAAHIEHLSRNPRCALSDPAR